jgi:hypothetical protein
VEITIPGLATAQGYWIPLKKTTKGGNRVNPRRRRTIKRRIQQTQNDWLLAPDWPQDLDQPRHCTECHWYHGGQTHWDCVWTPFLDPDTCRHCNKWAHIPISIKYPEVLLIQNPLIKALARFIYRRPRIPSYLHQSSIYFLVIVSLSLLYKILSS